MEAKESTNVSQSKIAGLDTHVSQSKIAGLDTHVSQSKIAGLDTHVSQSKIAGPRKGPFTFKIYTIVTYFHSEFMDNPAIDIGKSYRDYESARAQLQSEGNIIINGKHQDLQDIFDDTIMCYCQRSKQYDPYIFILEKDCE